MKAIRLISFVVFLFAIGWSQQLRAFSIFQCPQTPTCQCYTAGVGLEVQMFCDGGGEYLDECAAFKAECSSYCLGSTAINDCNAYFAYGDCVCRIPE